MRPSAAGSRSEHGVAEAILGIARSCHDQVDRLRGRRGRGGGGNGHDSIAVGGEATCDHRILTRLAWHTRGRTCRFKDHSGLVHAILK